MGQLAKDIVDSIQAASKAKTTAYDTTATVRRIEGDTAWVHIPGGVDETPVKLTINAKAGDNVQVRVSGGSAFLVGNGSAPPTDDARANQAYTVATVAEGAAQNALANAARAAEAADSAQASATRAEGAANDAAIAAGDAQTAAGNAQTAADTALVNLATTEDVVGVLNWITAHGTMTTQSGEVFVPGQVYFVSDPAGDYVVGGNHYSVVPEPKAEDIDSYYILTVNESVQNYVATHIVVDSEGLWIIPDAGGNKVLIATGSGSTYTTAGTYIVGAGNVTLASFTASGAQIGENASGKSRTEIGSAGMQIIQNVSGTDTQIANLGYGSGTAQSGTANAPYYTLGVRRSGSVVGNYSVSEGLDNTASGYVSHAEGRNSIASGPEAHAEGGSTAQGNSSHAEGNGSRALGAYSHAEGAVTEAVGVGSHAEGGYTDATGIYSHAEGTDTVASGDYSHSQNRYTIAQRKSQTVIGEYNIADTAGADGTERGDYVFIIGNGEGIIENPRSNALTVDWSGNVEAAGDVTDGSGNTLSAVASALSSLIVVETKTLGTNVSVSANSTTPSYNIPSKTGYTIAAVTPMVTGSYNGHYFAAITSSDNTVPTSLYFKNTHSSAHSNSFYIRIVYIKN